MPKEKKVLENEMFERFSKFSANTAGILTAVKDDSAVLSVVRRIFNCRSHFDSTEDYDELFPHILFIVIELCEIGDNLVKEDDYLEEFKESCSLISEYIKKNLSSIECELSLLFYTFANSKAKNVERDKNEVKEIQKEIHNDKIDVERIYSKTGVHLFSKKYSDISGDESFAKVAWLVCLFLLSATIVCVIVWFTSNIIELNPKSYLDVFCIYAERIPVVVISLIFFVWVSKRYAIAREKELIYRHLATTLHVFKAFYKTAEPEHKRLVLLEAAKTLFPAPIDKNTSKLSDSGNLLDVVKILSKKVKDSEH